MHTTGKRIGLVAVAGAAALALTTFNSDSGTTLTAAGANRTGSQVDSSVRKDWVIGDAALCLQGEGAATVQSVAPKGDVELVAYAIRPNPYATPGAQMQGVRDSTFAQRKIRPYAGAALTRTCGPRAEDSYELIMQLRSGRQSTVAKGFDVTYAIDGERRVLTVPMTVILCVNPTDEVCELSPQPMPTQDPPVTYTS